MQIQKIPKEDILAVIEKLGPCQPIDIRKELKASDSFLIGALLSELVGEQRLAISHTRRGGGPFYYDPLKPETLESISKYLNEKDRRTYAMLKEQKIMREDAQEPLVRVGLQSIHDFSKRIEIDGVVYWRYFLSSEEEAITLVKGKKPSAQKEMMKEEASEKPAQQETLISQAILEETPKKKRAPRKKVTQTTLPTETDLLANDTLYEKVQKFAAKEGELENPKIVKVHAEMTALLSTKATYGTLSYFLIAFNKKKITEKDITKYLLQAHGLGTPLLILSVEELPPKLTKSFTDMHNVYFKRL